MNTRIRTFLGLLTTAAFLSLTMPTATAEAAVVECDDVEFTLTSSSPSIGVDDLSVLADGQQFEFTRSALCEVLTCPNPGNQGTLANNVPYLIVAEDTGWEGNNYYVYGTTYALDVYRYNYCVSNVQVGAVSVGGYSSWSWSIKVI